ncbi:MAG: carboxymuconolactone decarboxylase family protein [Verrucomicrobia bacterium]|nr:carboxymuconolactone decarboxylase family protein [Verrucomicrobiota bacterium]
MPTPPLPIVLILCTGNSCRSHLAEGILRQAAGDLLDVRSAGSQPAGYVHPLAIQVMAEIGIDLSGHHSKHMDEFLQQDVETVITVCGHADQACPMFPGQLIRHHWGFADPAHAQGSEDEKLAMFRRVRDEIKMVFEAYADGRRDEVTSGIFSPAVGELVAIGAAIAANCEPCLKYHYGQANQLGISKSDMAHAVRTAAMVKDAPHQAILRLAERLTGNSPSQSNTLSTPCCSDTVRENNPSACCNDDNAATAAKTRCC